MGMKSRWVLVVLAMAPVFVLNSCSSSNISVNTSFMWVATQGDQMVRSYTISQNNGEINPIGSNGAPVATGAQPQAMIITPDGQTMFIANAGGTVTAYKINSDASLSAAGSPVNAGSVPVALTTDPAGKFLFVANQGSASSVTSGTISVFAISGTTLTQVPKSPFPTELPADVSGSGPSGLTVSPVGSYLYVANQFTNNVQSYSYDSSGDLTLINTYTAGTNPTGLAFSRCAGITSATTTTECTVADDSNLFVTNSGSNNISIFSACIQVSASCAAPNGTLAEIPSGSPVPAGVGPATILIDRTSNFVYAVDRGSSEVSEYQYSPATGVLTPLATGSGGTSVFSGGITSNIANTTSTFNWLVLTNNGSSNLSTFQVAVTGKLIAPSTGQYAVQGQPSAILLR